MIGKLSTSTRPTVAHQFDQELQQPRRAIADPARSEKGTGKPAAFIESDLVDPRYFSAANIKNRLESYFQMIKRNALPPAPVLRTRCKMIFVPD
jgi:hypothetical protein